MQKIRIFFIVSALLLLAVHITDAADKMVAWDPVPSASGYRISISTDNGNTWTQVADVPATETQATVTIPDSGITLIRASSYNNIGEAIGTTNGVWFNPDWQISSAPAALRTPGE